MKHNLFSIISLLVIVLLLTACAPQQSIGGPETPVVISDNGSVEDRNGLLEALKSDAVKNEGVKVELGGSVDQPFFSVKGQIIQINNVDVQVFEYTSSEAMAADANRVASDGGSIGTSMVSWMAPPHFFKTGRVLVLYIGDNGAVLNLLKGELGEQFAGR
jgi:hypothetical protein